MQTKMRKIIALSFFILFLSACTMTKKDPITPPPTQEQEAVFPSLCDAQTGVKELSWENPPKMEIDTNKKYSAVLKTNLGEITLSLAADKAPTTVNNFVFLARQGFYDCVTFHRVIKNFMIQGGDPLGLGFGDPGYKFADEFHPELSNTKGTISMANSGPDTNGSQFFINLADNTNLDFDKEPLTSKHAVFGYVENGMDVVELIGKRRTNAQDAPLQNIYIESIEIIEQ
jgi:cyclophilin family peptidyl-prolyl cis-trans isomerase